MAKQGKRERPTPRVLDDPRAIRALAHPARLAVLDALADGVELTATACAEIAGITPSAMSYHLRALEKWGLVERVETSPDGRERPWRRYPGGYSINAMPDAATAAATAMVTTRVLSRVADELGAWFDIERTEPPVWSDNSGVDNRSVWLDGDEVAELRELLRAFLEPRLDRTADDRPEGARRVRVTQIVVPLDAG